MQLVKVTDRTIEYVRKYKDRLEKRLKVSLYIAEGGIELNGESVAEYIAKDVIKAVDVGFRFDDAVKLLDKDYSMKIIDLKRLGLSHSAINRQIARIIGEHGRAKRMFEGKGNVKLSISGHSVAVLGPYTDVDIIVQALLRLISGSPHKNVYRYIDEAEIRKEAHELGHG